MQDFGFITDGEPIVAQPQESDRGTAKQNQSLQRCKSEINTAYDAMRSDPKKAESEGMKMHNAYFGKHKLFFDKI